MHDQKLAPFTGRFQGAAGGSAGDIVPGEAAPTDAPRKDGSGRRFFVPLRPFPRWSRSPARGRDDAGRSVGSDVYYCRFETGGVSETRKTLLSR